jgi:hypothetical protein
MDVLPSRIFHGFLFHFYLFFLCEKADFGFILDSKNAERWDLPGSDSIATRRTPIGYHGRCPPVAFLPGLKYVVPTTRDPNAVALLPVQSAAHLPRLSTTRPRALIPSPSTTAIAVTCPWAIVVRVESSQS